MKNKLIKRLVIFVLIMGACYGIFYFLSSGRPSVPDASQYRDTLYLYTFYILPLILLGNCFYLISCFISNAPFLVVISLLFGLLGPAWLAYSVHSSPDPMASMAMLLIVHLYAIFSFIAFIILVIIQLLRRRFTSKSG